MSETYVDPSPPPPPDPPVNTMEDPLGALFITADELLREHDLIDPRDLPNINPQAAPPLLGSAYTVTVANPTPPTNIADVACGTPPHFTAVFSQTPHMPLIANQVTYSDDLALMATAAATVPTPGSITSIATPIGGSSGPVSEATGTVVVVTAPGSVTASPTQMISVQGNFTATPNASHPSSASHISYVMPNPTPASGGTGLLTVSGFGYDNSSVVNVAGAAQTTVFVNANTLTVAAAPKRATAGTSTVSVTTGAVTSPTTSWTFT